MSLRDEIAENERAASDPLVCVPVAQAPANKPARHAHPRNYLHTEREVEVGVVAWNEWLPAGMNAPGFTGGTFPAFETLGHERVLGRGARDVNIAVP